ncbi:MAG: AsmA-like C-terminal domain-containing protein [Alphaproteobacteria bacterium]
MHRAPKVILHSLAAVFGLLLILFAGAALRLSSGPVSLSFLTPYIDESLQERYPSYRIRFDDIILAWAGWKRSLDVRALDVRITDDANHLLAEVPEVSFGLSGPALLRGLVEPTSIELIRPTIRLARDADGAIMFEMGTEPGESEAPLEEFITDVAVGTSATHEPLRQFSVIDADLFINDRANEVTWHASGVDVNLYHTDEGITGDLALEIALGDVVSHVEADILRNRSSDTLDFEIRVVDILPSRLATITPHLAELTALEMPLSGRIGLHLDSSFVIETVDFDLSGSSGRLTLPSLFKGSLQTELLEAKGRILDQFTTLRLDELYLDFGGPTLILRGLVRELEDDFALEGEIEFTDLPVDDADHYWPNGLAPSAREWLTARVHHGTAQRIFARVKLTGADLERDPLPRESVDGEVILKNISVDYLDGLPPVVGLDVGSTFDGTSFNIIGEGGRINDVLELSDGHIKLTDVGRTNSLILDVTIRGPASSALEVLNVPRLGYPAKFGIDPGDASGQVESHLHFAFPLRNALRIEDIEIEALATLHDFGLRNIEDGYELSDGQFFVTLDTDGLELRGSARVNGTPVDLEWQEDFGEAGEFLSQITLSGAIDDAGWEALGLAPSTYLSGPVETKIIYRDIDRRRKTINIDIDVRDSELAIPEFFWSKRPGVDGRVQLQIGLAEGMPIEIEHFVVVAQDLSAEGRAVFEPGFGKLLELDASRIAFGANDFSIRMVPLAEAREGYDVAITGESFDLRPYIDELFEDEESKTPPFVLSLKVRRLITREDQQITDVVGHIDYADDRWRSASFDGRLPSGETLRMRLAPTEDNKRSFDMTSSDAGSVARVFDLYDNGIGGELELTAIIDDNLPDRPVEGLVTIENYRIINAPTLAQILNFAGLLGILDSLQGDGIGFSSFRLPFKFANGRLDIDEARTHGPSLGINVSGTVDVEADQTDLSGTIVPAYAINSLLSNIPIIGDIVTGGEGEGIIAATFTVDGPIDEPSISVNPASMLAPGFLRNLFGLFDGGGGSESDGDGEPDAGALDPDGPDAGANKAVPGGKMPAQ